MERRPESQGGRGSTHLGSAVDGGIPGPRRWISGLGRSYGGRLPWASNDPARSRNERRGEAVDGGRVGVAIGARTGRGERRTTAETRPRSRGDRQLSNGPKNTTIERGVEAVDGGRVEGWPNGPYGRGKPTRQSCKDMADVRSVCLVSCSRL